MSNNVKKLTLLFCLMVSSFSIKTADEFINSSTNNQTEEACLQESCETISKEDNVTEDLDVVNNFLHGQTIEISNERVIPWQISNSCPVGMECHLLPADCILCKFNFTCVYGNSVNVSCQAISKCEVGINKIKLNVILAEEGNYGRRNYLIN